MFCGAFFVPIAAQMPQTGDANNVSTAILAAVLSLAAVIAVAIFIVKNKE